MTGRELRLQGEQRGSATVELAVLTPLLILLVLLIVLAHRLTTATQAADAAAHAGARAATLERTPEQARLAAEGAVADALRTHELSCSSHTLTLEMGALEPGGTVSAALTCQADFSGLTGLGVPLHRDVKGEADAVVDVYRGHP